MQAKPSQADTPAGWMKCPTCVSLGKVVWSTARTLSPSRASISARAEPAQRAPTMTTSYMVIAFTTRAVRRRHGTAIAVPGAQVRRFVSIVSGLAVRDADRHTFDRPRLEIE
jgi:hypothetical protein